MKARRRLPALLALLMATTGLAAVTASQSSPALRLFDLTTAHGIEAERPWQPAKYFAPDDAAIYLWFAAEGCAWGTTIRSTWFYMETDPPRRLGSASVVVDRPGTWGQFNYAPASGTRWAIGRYRVELRVNGELIAETFFTVTAQTDVRREQSRPAVRMTRLAPASGR